MSDRFDKLYVRLWEQHVVAPGAYKLSSSFTDLPDNPPHGFWITSDGKFIVVRGSYGHDEALETLFPGKIATGNAMVNLTNAMKNGMIRVGKVGNNYELTYNPMFMKSRAGTKTAKDIAEFYNMGIIDHFED